VRFSEEYSPLSRWQTRAPAVHVSAVPLPSICSLAGPKCRTFSAVAVRLSGVLPQSVASRAPDQKILPRYPQDCPCRREDANAGALYKVCDIVTQCVFSLILSPILSQLLFGQFRVVAQRLISEFALCHPTVLGELHEDLYPFFFPFLVAQNYRLDESEININP
jgi:hypothetical protein